MLISILFLFWLDLGSELVPFWLHFGSSFRRVWFHFGSILAPFGIHFETIWTIWRCPVEEKLPSRTQGRKDRTADTHFKRCWSQKGGHKASQNRLLVAKGGHKASQNRWKIDEKSMQKSMRNSAGVLHGLGSVFGRLWGCFWDPGPLILSVSSRRGANFQNFVFSCLGWLFGDF